VQAAGAFAVVLELVPMALAEIITERLEIPTIGIGAGVGCDGQVQVFHDILALFDQFLPRHAKQYAQIGDLMREAIQAYQTEVLERRFPTAENGFKMGDEVVQQLRSDVQKDDV